MAEDTTDYADFHDWSVGLVAAIFQYHELDSVHIGEREVRF